MATGVPDPEFPKTVDSTLTESLMRGAIWALVGIIFGFIFVVLHAYFHDPGRLCLCYLYANVAAGALGALVYGSLRLSVIVASNALVVIIGYFLIVTPESQGPVMLMLLGGGTGMIIGAIYAIQVSDSRVFRAEAKIIAGAIAGLLASPLALLPSLWVGPIPFPWLTAILCPATGLIYVSIAPRMVQRCCHFLPRTADGAVVGAGVGGTMGLLFWIMAGTIDRGVAPEYAAFVAGIADHWPLAVVGASVAAFIGGIVRSVVGAQWYDL